MRGWSPDPQPYQWQKMSKPLTEAQKQAEQAAMTPVEYSWGSLHQDGVGFVGEVECYTIDALAGQFTASE